jgi:hypothetical protein
MAIVRPHRKRNNLKTLERYHIYKIVKDNLQMNDTHKPIFKALQVINNQIAENMHRLLSINTDNFLVTLTTNNE